MLIGNGTEKPDLQMVRRIKRSLHQALQLPEDAMMTVAQLACLEKDCAPLETVVGLLRPGMPRVQHKLHKSIDEFNADDLVQISVAWGFSVHSSTTKHARDK